ncbi:MAG: hypothetical protein ACHQF2_02625 [Flavobacteriales bacterium]
MKKYVFIIGFLLPLQALAQNDQPKQKLFKIQRAGLYGTAGMHNSDYKGINKILSDSGYSEFYKNKFTLGFGFTVRTHRTIVNLDYLLFSQCNVNADFMCSHIDFSSYGAMIGFDITKKEKLDFYPFLGISRNRTDILLSYVTFPEMPLQTFLLTNSNIARITRVNYSLHLGAGFDYFLPVSKKYSSEFLVGIYAGYYMQINEGTWFIHVDELPLTNAPFTNPGGAYIKAKLGICF